MNFRAFPYLASCCFHLTIKGGGMGRSRVQQVLQDDSDVVNSDFCKDSVFVRTALRYLMRCQYYIVFIIQLSYCPFMLFHKVVTVSVLSVPCHLFWFYFSLCFSPLWVLAAAVAEPGYVKPPCVRGVTSWHVIRFSAAQVRARLGFVLC